MQAAPWAGEGVKLDVLEKFGFFWIGWGGGVQGQTYLLVRGRLLFRLVVLHRLRHIRSHTVILLSFSYPFSHVILFLLQ
jgi:hypothetical protein